MSVENKEQTYQRKVVVVTGLVLGFVLGYYYRDISVDILFHERFKPTAASVAAVGVLIGVITMPKERRKNYRLLIYVIVTFCLYAIGHNIYTAFNYLPITTKNESGLKNEVVSADSILNVKKEIDALRIAQGVPKNADSAEIGISSAERSFSGKDSRKELKEDYLISRYQIEKCWIPILYPKNKSVFQLKSDNTKITAKNVRSLSGFTVVAIRDAVAYEDQKSVNLVEDILINKGDEFTITNIAEHENSYRIQVKVETLVDFEY